MKSNVCLARFHTPCIIVGLLAVIALSDPLAADAQIERSQDAIALLQSAAVNEIAAHYHQTQAAMKRDAFDWTPLMIAAAANSDAAVIDTLLDKGEIIEARSLDGWTALMFASAFNPHPEVTRALLGAGADPQRRSRDAWSALLGAARYTGENLRFDGLEAIPDKNRLEPAADEDRGWAALFMAARFNAEPQVVQALLAGGADPNARDEYGRTALYYARRHNSTPRVAQLLISAAAEH